MGAKGIVGVSVDVEVTVDEGKFTPDFYREFDRKNAFPLAHNLSSHLVHLAKLYTSGAIGDGLDVPGYGNLKEMNIEFKILGQSGRIIELDSDDCLIFF